MNTDKKRDFEKLQRDTGFQPVLVTWESARVNFKQFLSSTHGLEARVTMRRLHIRSFSKASILLIGVYRWFILFGRYTLV